MSNFSMELQPTIKYYIGYLLKAKLNLHLSSSELSLAPQLLIPLHRKFKGMQIME